MIGREESGEVCNGLKVNKESITTFDRWILEIFEGLKNAGQEEMMVLLTLAGIFGKLDAKMLLEERRWMVTLLYTELRQLLNCFRLKKELSRMIGA